MHQGQTVFSQGIAHLPEGVFRRIVARHSGNRRVRSFSCRDRYLCMTFAQLTYRESLRDIEACLRARGDGLYHLGIRGRVSRSTLVDANDKRDRSTGLICGQTIVLTDPRSADHYADPLRRVRFRDESQREAWTYLTNDFDLPALTVAELYRSRWQIELFFKWIKQHLRIKAFYGSSANAVRTEMWIAVTAYVLVAIVRKRLEVEVEVELYTFLQILSVYVSEKVPLARLLAGSAHTLESTHMRNQLSLFDFLPDTTECPWVSRYRSRARFQEGPCK